MSEDYKSIQCDLAFIDRQPISAGHEKFRDWCGRLECQLEVLTPLRINTWEDKRSPAFIQGSTIKGMVRSVAEMISQSCFRIGKPLLPEFKACTSKEKACTCCRLFGGTFTEYGEGKKESSAFQSKVFFEDTYVPGNKLKDIQVYVSHQDGQFDMGARRIFPHSTLDPGGDINILIAPKGTIFNFGIEFECLSHGELGLLLYSLILEPGMAHKMGFMKSRGLGSVRIMLTKMDLTQDYSIMFKDYDSSIQVFVDEELGKFSGEKIKNYLQVRNLNESKHLNDMRNYMKYEEV